MKNFDYLQQIPALRDLYNFCNSAEEMQHADHDTCGWNCRKALDTLPQLKGCQAHSTVMLKEVDWRTFKKLGIDLTTDPAKK